MFEGDAKCVGRLLAPAERVLKVGRDIYRESYEKRRRLWEELEENYDCYLSGECGDFLPDLDRIIKGKFEAAMALLALSFRINGELFDQRRFRDEDIALIDEVTKFNVFEILTVDDILKKLYRRDGEVYELLRTYYLGLDRWVEERMQDPNVSLNLRTYVRAVWQRYKEKLNQAFAEANKYDWFGTILEDWEREKSGLFESFSLRVRELEERIGGMRRSFEEEREKLISHISESQYEVERLKREKEELVRRFEEERERIAKEIEEMKDQEREKLRRELELERGRILSEIMELEQRLREKELQVQAREREVERREEELRRRISEVARMQAGLEKGTRLVRAEEARMMEMNFVERLRSKLKEVVIGDTRFRAEVMEEVEISVLIPSPTPTSINPPEKLTVLAVDMKERKIFSGKKFRIYAVFYVRPGRLAEFGFDTDPVELREVEGVLSKFVKGNRYAIVIASPLGFEERVRRFVNSEDFYRNFYSERISLLLLDTETNEVIYNPNDLFAKSLAGYVQLEIEPETYARVRRCVESRLKDQGRDYLALSDALDCGDERLVRRAFYEIARDSGWDVRYIEGFGLVMVRNRRR